MRRSSPLLKRHCASSIGMREEAAHPAELDGARRNEMGCRSGAGRILALGIGALIRAYQLIVAPVLPPSCRFYPSCSHYAAEAVERHGPWRGLVLALRGARAWPPLGGQRHRPGPPGPEPLAAPAPTAMDQRNLLLAIVLSVGILIGFQFLFEKIRPTPQPPSPAVPTHTAPPTPAPGAAASGTAPGAAAPGTSAPGAPSMAGVAPAPGAETREEAIAEQPRVKIDTPRLHGSVALTGGRIDDLTLATYHETTDPRSPEVVLLWPSGTKDPYFAEFGWVAGGAGAKVPGPETRWTAAGGPLPPTSPVTLSWDNGAGLLFARTITIDENYMFTVRDAVKNTGT